MFALRNNAVSESQIFTDNPHSTTIIGFFLQPGLDVTSQLAAALGLMSKDTSLRTLAETRMMFACSSSIKHVLGPDRARVTFASYSGLALQWFIVIRLELERDWLWDGFPMDGIRVVSGDQDVVSCARTHNANEGAFHDQFQSDPAQIS
jgi:hypothetical protein